MHGVHCAAVGDDEDVGLVGGGAAFAAGGWGGARVFSRVLVVMGSGGVVMRIGFCGAGGSTMSFTVELVGCDILALVGIRWLLLAKGRPSRGPSRPAGHLVVDI